MWPTTDMKVRLKLVSSALDSEPNNTVVMVIAQTNWENIPTEIQDILGFTFDDYEDNPGLWNN